MGKKPTHQNGAVNGSNNGTPLQLADNNESVHEAEQVPPGENKPHNEPEEPLTAAVHETKPVIQKKTAVNERKEPVKDKPKWTTWGVNVGADDQSLIEIVYNEFLKENPGATKSDFVKCRLLSNPVHVQQPTITVQKIEFPTDLRDLVIHITNLIAENSTAEEFATYDVVCLTSFLMRVQPVIDARVESKITVNELHFLKQCVDFAINYNRKGKKYENVSFAVPYHEIDIEDGFYK